VPALWELAFTSVRTACLRQRLTAEAAIRPLRAAALASGVGLASASAG